jgi:hypothetical protein
MFLFSPFLFLLKNLGKHLINDMLHFDKWIDLSYGIIREYDCISLNINVNHSIYENKKRERGQVEMPSLTK